jgi:hypothetical protein
MTALINVFGLRRRSLEQRIEPKRIVRRLPSSASMRGLCSTSSVSRLYKRTVDLQNANICISGECHAISGREREFLALVAFVAHQSRGMFIGLQSTTLEALF